MIKLIFGHKSQICIWIESRNWNGILFRLMLENPLKCNDNNVQLMYEWITWPNRLAVASMHRRCEILQQINGLHIIAENNVIFGIGILFPIRGMRLRWSWKLTTTQKAQSGRPKHNRLFVSICTLRRVHSTRSL